MGSRTWGFLYWVWAKNGRCGAGAEGKRNGEGGEKIQTFFRFLGGLVCFQREVVSAVFERAFRSFEYNRARGDLFWGGSQGSLAPEFQMIASIVCQRAEEGKLPSIG
jgi:hypothetical protein